MTRCGEFPLVFDKCRLTVKYLIRFMPIWEETDSLAPTVV